MNNIDIDLIASTRKPDPLTHTRPIFHRELCGFDKPSTFKLTVEENRANNLRVFNRRKGQ